MLRLRPSVLGAAFLALLLVLAAVPSLAQQGGISLPRVAIGVEAAQGPREVGASLQILFLLTILSIAPALLLMTTCFTRVIIILSLLRTALGTPQIPPNQVLIGLALFLTLFIMRPTWTEINDRALQPYLAEQVTAQVAIERAAVPMRRFMLKQTYESDLVFFRELSPDLRGKPLNRDTVPLSILAPAFLLSEIKTGFIYGFYLFLPFLIIDLVVAAVLMSLGMMMLPPTTVSTPLKILLIVLASGWTLVVQQIVRGYG